MLMSARFAMSEFVPADFGFVVEVSLPIVAVQLKPNGDRVAVLDVVSVRRGQFRVVGDWSEETGVRTLVQLCWR